MSPGINVMKHESGIRSQQDGKQSHTGFKTLISTLYPIIQRAHKHKYSKPVFQKCWPDPLNKTVNQRLHLVATPMSVMSQPIAVAGRRHRQQRTFGGRRAPSTRAAEVPGWLPAAWSLTIWQLSRSKTQAMFGINRNRQQWPPPPQFVSPHQQVAAGATIIAASFLVTSNRRRTTVAWCPLINRN